MPSLSSITPSQLVRCIGLPDSAIIFDVRTTEDFAADPRLIPGSRRASHVGAADWTAEWQGRQLIVSCHKGRKLSEGVAAWLRHHGAEAEVLEGGHLAWTAAGLALIRAERLPPAAAQGRTVWVTRARPKVDRIACPWLIRRFIDPRAVFLFVAAAEVADVAGRFDATPFDIEGVEWSHRGPLCTFDVMLAEFGLATPALNRLVTIIRGADTAELGLAPEAAGLLAISLGLSRQYRDDLAQLEAGMSIYDALYRWCRDATDETHNWPSGKPA
jgi:rhodanese-related sulfurtransferase